MVCTTLIGSALRELEGIIFDVVIIDEASQALEPECWAAILKAKKVIFVGDHKQLPPRVKSQEAKKIGLEITMLDRFTEIASHTCMLKEQYIGAYWCSCFVSASKFPLLIHVITI